MFWADQLLGSYKAPMLANSWRLSDETLAEIVSENLTNSDLGNAVVKSNNFIGEVGDLDWGTFAEQAASILASRDDEWARQCASGIYTTDSEILIDDLPLLQQSVRTLELMRIPLQTDLGDALDRSRSDFLAFPLGALTLLDLEIQAQNFPKGEVLLEFKYFGFKEKTLETIAARLIDSYRSLDGNRLGPEWTDYFLRRFSWGQPKATLDLIGSDADLTRERVRQLIGRVMKYIGWRKWPMPPTLIEVIQLLKDHDFNDVESVISNSAFATDDDWTADEILELTAWLGYPNLVQLLESRFDTAMDKTVERDTQHNELVKIIRKSRSPLGILDANGVYLTDGTKVGPQEVKAATRRIYERYFESGDWILCGMKNALTTAERKAAQQLTLIAPLTAAEVFEGIERHRRYKGAPALPPLDTMINLLRESGLLELQGDSVVGLVDVTIDGLNAWLANELLSAPEQVLHKDMIYREAISDKRNVSSLTILFLYNSLLRPIDNPKGLVRLIGSNPSEEAKFAAKTVASALAEPSHLEFEVNPDSVLLNFQLGSYAVSTGIYQAPAALRDLWPKSGAESRCFCDHKTDAVIKIKNGSQLLGMHPLIAHMLLEHNGQIGSVISAKLQSGAVQALRIT